MPKKLTQEDVKRMQRTECRKYGKIRKDSHVAKFQSKLDKLR